MNRPETTLFMLMSVDGKISTGDTDTLDFDRDLRTIQGAKEGLDQYYKLEQETDLFSLNTGRVMAKIGVNDRADTPEKMPVSFIIIDNEPHLTALGVRYLANWTKKLFVVTTNAEHPATENDDENVEVICYDEKIDFSDLFTKLKTEHGVTALTLQSGGTLNATLVREGLVDNLSVVVAPIVVGGKDTPTLVDGESLHSISDLAAIQPLTLVEAKKLDHNYLQLRYRVNHQR